LHLATHYIADSNSPMLSKLVLAGGKQESDTVLYAHEIFRLKSLKARLAVLAGCQTGVEGYFNSEGAMGLARPFKAAGVPVVIASLWPVDSDATTDLMINFHRLRKRERHSSAEALRLAQVSMLKFHPNPAYHHPYYWASFVQTGGYSDY
jgi:CHAT domain-containing protein